VTAAEDLRKVASAVEGERLLERLDQLALLGADPSGGTTRIAFSPEEDAALQLVSDWLEQAGLTPTYDDFGNLFASNDGNQPGAVTSASGSHLDTVPNGGPLDGALGVVAAIEAVEAMRAAEALPPRPLEVVIWRCEEPVRFSQGKVGSLLFSGQLTLDELSPLGEPPFDVASALSRENRQPRRDASRRIGSLLELHIEQGRRLERAGLPVGVVTAVAAPIRGRITIEGRADHSGSTPMDDRRDALAAAAEVVLAVEDAGRSEAKSESVATSADITCHPGAINVVPGRAEVLVDIRGVDPTSMERLVEGISASCEMIASRRALDIHITILSRGVPTVLRESVIRRLEEVVRTLGHEPLLLPSGAGHDAQCLAGSADVGILFAPSVDGVSHSPGEFTRPEDVIESARALAAGWLALAAT
jgi:hydantoinase/carbamoylase family amidase